MDFMFDTNAFDKAIENLEVLDKLKTIISSI